MNFELRPTYDNIIKTLNEDILGRNITLKRFVKTLYLMKDINIISLNENGELEKHFSFNKLLK